MKINHLIFAAVFLFVSFFAESSFAGGPFVVDGVGDTGVAQRWVNDTLMWYVDGGNLSNTVSNETAREWVEEAIEKWTGATLQDSTRDYIGTTNVQATFVSDVGYDINSTNFWDYLDEEAGPTVIIFDRDGLVTREIAAGTYENIPGLTDIRFSSSSGISILRGVVIFNGLTLDSGLLTEDQFKAAMLHELGHLFNLDHTQVNLDIAELCTLGGTCTDGQYIPTMFPLLKTDRQSALSVDDKVTLSWIYPNNAFSTSFCTIIGEIQDQSGNPLQGVNVLARRVADGESLKKEDVRSMVSGVMYPACHADGHYYLYGIVPGKTYEVFYEPISEEFTDLSGFEPLDSPPQGFDSATITSSSGETTVSCDEGGETITMQIVKVPVATPCTTLSPIGNSDDTDGSGSTASSGGCSLILR